jgi:hypothetical protein
LTDASSKWLLRVVIVKRAFLSAVDPTSAEAHDGPVDPALVIISQAARAEQVSSDHALQA